MSVSVWEAIFMLLVLKIPMIYLAAVVLWAVRGQPDVLSGGDEIGVPEPSTPCGWNDWQRGRVRPTGRRPLRPSGGRLAARARIS